VASYWERGDWARANQLAGEVIGRAEAEGSPRARGSAYWNASLAASAVGGVTLALELAERAIAMFSPAALLFVGVAGALRSSVALGDVVVATHVYAYHGGTSEDDGFKSRPRVWETSHAADQIARHVKRSGSWIPDLAPGSRVPDVHFGPIAAGEVVLDSTTSAHALLLGERYNDALAIEMEGAGVAQAGHLNQSLPVVVIRGISDRADGTKATTDSENWQPRAVANAAAFAAVLSDELATDLDTRDDDEKPAKNGSPPMPESIRNIVMGNARVGVQAGNIYGDIRFSGNEPEQPDDLAEALGNLRTRLRRAQAAGSLDEDTYVAALAELTVAEEALPHDRGRLTLALKKLRGLVADDADLAAHVATAITLARSLS
jgi:8-oxo-dGTP diphosphatase